MLSSRLRLIALACAVGAGINPSIRALAAERLDLREELAKDAHWRSLGPANMGGRVADIAVDEKSPYTIYLALATGGLLKSTNNGTSWSSIFDSEPVASIGAVAIAPSNSKVIWVGTGEANGRNSSSWGNGVYRSTDGGASWTHVGLERTQEIGRIVVDPADDKIAYVAAAGRLWAPNRQRGLFKTTDAGKTWHPALQIDRETGAIDAALGPPGTVFAAMYRRQRFPWGFTGEGETAGIYKSADSGQTWKKLTVGLPSGPLGRIGLSVCRSKPDVIYSVIESEEGGSDSLFDTRSRHGGVFRSDNAGETWTRVSATAPRGFYFSQIRVDPTNAERVYVLGFDLIVSDNGGKIFKPSSHGVHSDLHALWIDPARPDRLLVGSDGGIYTSFDKGETWDPLDGFPMGEFYEVATDNRTPFWVYGGMQDNGCWAGPSALEARSGPDNANWVPLSGGDGFYAVPDPSDPEIVYTESQGGALERIDFHTNRRRPMHPAAPEGTPDYRFNWNTPVAVSHFDHDHVYLGGNQLFQYSNQGKEWKAISPDLSKQEGEHITAAGSGAETYGTIVTLSESPIQQGVIWAGTDDGNVQVTQDQGAHWTNVTDHLPEKLRHYWIARIEASHFQAGRAYVAIDGHRSNDFETLIFATDDFGATWRAVHGDLPAEEPVHTIREDPVTKNLLFAGTEFGAYVSFDQGQHWHKLSNDMPTVAVDDLNIQARDHSLVAATHGRSLCVVDNIAPLEDEAAQEKSPVVRLFPIPPAYEYLPSPVEQPPTSHNFRAENRPAGAEMVVWLEVLADHDPQIAITGADDKSVANLSTDRLPGLHRLTWDLRRAATPEESAAGQPGPHFVKPGSYKVTLTIGSEKQTQVVEVSGNRALSEIPLDESPESGVDESHAGAR